MKCGNNLRQIIIATHNANDTIRYLPPAIGWYPSSGPASGSGYGTLFYHLLPYVEQGNLYKTGLTSKPNHLGQNPGNYYSGETGAGTPSYVGTQIVKTFVCPSDPSVPANGIYIDSVYGLPW